MISLPAVGIVPVGLIDTTKENYMYMNSYSDKKKFHPSITVIDLVSYRSYVACIILFLQQKILLSLKILHVQSLRVHVWRPCHV